MSRPASFCCGRRIVNKNVSVGSEAHLIPDAGAVPAETRTHNTTSSAAWGSPPRARLAVVEQRRSVGPPPATERTLLAVRRRGRLDQARLASRPFADLGFGPLIRHVRLSDEHENRRRRHHSALCDDRRDIVHRCQIVPEGTASTACTRIGVLPNNVGGRGAEDAEAATVTCAALCVSERARAQWQALAAAQ